MVVKLSQSQQQLITDEFTVHGQYHPDFLRKKGKPCNLIARITSRC